MSVLVAADPAHPVALPEHVEFLEAPPGMLGLRRFTLTALDDTGFLFALRADENPAVRLFVIPPRPYFPDYAPRLDRATVDGLGEEDPVLLVVVHPGDGGAPTANLLAPVAVSSSGRALQLVLDGDEWPLRAPMTTAGSAA